MACEVGLYYVLHFTKQRNKNALLRLLPGLGEGKDLLLPSAPSPVPAQLLTVPRVPLMPAYP